MGITCDMIDDSVISIDEDNGRLITVLLSMVERIAVEDSEAKVNRLSVLEDRIPVVVGNISFDNGAEVSSLEDKTDD